MLICIYLDRLVANTIILKIMFFWKEFTPFLLVLELPKIIISYLQTKKVRQISYSLIS